MFELKKGKETKVSWYIDSLSFKEEKLVKVN